MGLISELHYEVKDANAIQHVTQKVAASGPGAWVFQRTLYPIDKGLYRLTKGRLTVPGVDGRAAGHHADHNRRQDGQGPDDARPGDSGG